MEGGSAQWQGAKGSVPLLVPATMAAGMLYIASWPRAEAEAGLSPKTRGDHALLVSAVCPQPHCPRSCHSQLLLQVQGLSGAEGHIQPIWPGGRGVGPNLWWMEVLGAALWPKPLRGSTGSLGPVPQGPHARPQGPTARSAQQGAWICCFSLPHCPAPQGNFPGLFRICFWGNALSHD